MPSSSLIKALPSRTCDGCGQQCLAHTVVMHGDDGLCQRCAYDRAIQSLSMEGGDSVRLKVIAAVAVVALGIGASAAWWGWNNWPGSLPQVTATSAIASAPGRAISTVISLPATPVPPE